MKRKIRKILIDLGVPFKLKGFKYIEDAVEDIIKVDDKSLISVCEVIGREYFVSSNSVYTTIGTAVKKINRESEAFKKYINSDTKSPTDILYTLAYRISEELEDEQDISARDS
jgi:hypothetical protein